PDASAAMVARRTQFDALAAAYDRLIVELKACGDPSVSTIGRTLEQSIAEMEQWLRDPASKITRSMLVPGMKQGLREGPLFLRDRPASIRLTLMAAYRTIVEEEVPGLLAFEREKLARIVVRGRVRNEEEFYLVRHRIDEIEGDSARRDELTQLYALVGK